MKNPFDFEITKTELQKFIAVVDCKEIQDKTNWDYCVKICRKCHKEIFELERCECVGQAIIKLPTIDHLLEMIRQKQPTLDDWEILRAFDVWWMHRNDADKLSFRIALVLYYKDYGIKWQQ